MRCFLERENEFRTSSYAAALPQPAVDAES